MTVKVGTPVITVESETSYPFRTFLCGAGRMVRIDRPGSVQSISDGRWEHARNRPGHVQGARCDYPGCLLNR